MHFLDRYYTKGEREMEEKPVVNSQYFEYTLSLTGGKWKLNLLFGFQSLRS